MKIFRANPKRSLTLCWCCGTQEVVVEWEEGITSSECPKCSSKEYWCCMEKKKEEEDRLND